LGPGLILVVAAAAAAAAIAQLFRASVPWPPAYRSLFEQMAGKYGVDENLLHALAWHESNLNPDAVGAKNTNGTTDYGIMQINSANFAALGLTTSTWRDPRVNIEGAAKLLRDIQRNADAAGSHLSLADTISVYNAGASKVRGRVGDAKQQEDADGGFINARYVAEVMGKYVMISAAAQAPVR